MAGRMKKSKNKDIHPLMRIFISIILLFVLWQSVQVLVLSFAGEITLGVITGYHSRVDDRQAQPNRSRTISKSYSFTVSGKEYKGYVIYGSDEAWPRLKEGEVRAERISYLAFFPYINKPAMLVDIDRIGPAGLLYHILVIPGCTFLFLLVNRCLGKLKKRAKKTNKIISDKMNTRRDKAMFCRNCGKKLPEGAVFCANCGAQVPKSPPPGICKNCGVKLKDEAAFCTNCGTSIQDVAEEAVNVTKQAAQPPLRKDIPPQNNTTLVGWSSISDDPEILEAARKNKKSTMGCGFILMLLFPIGFLLAGLFIDDMPLNEAIIIGVGLGVLMLVINLWRMKDLKGSVWEGVVTQKSNKERRSHNRDDDLTTYTEYTTVIKTEAGKEKRIIERDSRRQMYDYLAVGDRVRFHPAFATYEKYDKSKDKIIYCNVCSMMNPFANDRCKRCNNLLFK